MKVAKFLGLGCLLFVVSITHAAPQGSSYAYRQYYSSWKKPPQKPYYYRTYYYKPTPTYVGHKHHYVVYQPQKPKHLYFYNPYKKQYWGRCPVDHGGKPLYSLLAEKDRRGTIEEIPESAFPPPASLPPIPDSTDGATLDLPPDDLPPEESLPN